MYRSLLTLCLFSVTILHAQQITEEQYIGWRGNRVELHTITDKNKQNACSFLLNPDSIRVMYLEGMMIKKQFTVPRKPYEKLYGGFINNNKIYLFLDNGNGPGLHNGVFDLATDNSSEVQVPFETKREKLIDRFSCGDHFVTFTFNKKNSEFIIYDFHDAEKFTTMQYKFSEEVWQDISNDGFFSRSVKIDKVDVEGDCSLDIARNPKKIYLVNDTLHLLLNNKKGKTNVFSFDLRNQKVDSRIINHLNDSITYPSPSYVQNSFLLRNKLYYTQAGPDSFEVQVIDFPTGNILQRYKTGKDDEISFKNTPIIQEGGGFSFIRGTSRELDKTRQLLRKMVNGGAVIEATPNEKGQVEIMVGSYKQMSSGGGGGMWMPGAGVGAGAAPIYIPTGGFYRETWSKSARFKMLLDAGTGEHLNGEMDRSVNEKIEDYTKDTKIPPEAENLIQVNGRYYYTYYDREGRKLMTRQF